LLDPESTAMIRIRSEPVWINVGPRIKLTSYGSETLSGRTGTPLSETATWPDQNQTDSIFFQICCNL
jgi:hypothetical protein